MTTNHFYASSDYIYFMQYNERMEHMLDGFILWTISDPCKS